MRSFTFLSLLLACAACSGQPGAPSAPAAPANRPAAADPAAPADTLAQLRALIGTAACGDNSQCHSLPVGARACGGPEAYLAWSSTATSADALQALAGRYKAQRQAKIAASGEMSDCRFFADPGAVCRTGTCQPGAGAAGAQAR